MNRIFPPLPPVSELGSGAGEGLCGREGMGSHPGNSTPTAAFSLACDARVDSASEGGVESEHTGIGFTRNNTGPSAQHLGGEGSEGHSSPFDPSVYGIYQGQLGLGGWSCTDNAMDEYLDFLAGSARDPPVSDVVIETGPDNNV